MISGVVDAEIRDEPADGVLSAELGLEECSRSQAFPERTLGVGLLCPEFAGPWDEALGAPLTLTLSP